MATKKISKKDRLKERFATACIAMFESDGSSTQDGGEMTAFDAAAGDAMASLLELYGKGIDKKMLFLVLTLGERAAQVAYRKGYLSGHIDSMVDTGYLERSADGLYRATQKLKDTEPAPAA